MRLARVWWTCGVSGMGIEWEASNAWREEKETLAQSGALAVPYVCGCATRFDGRGTHELPVAPLIGAASARSERVRAKWAACMRAATHGREA